MTVDDEQRKRNARDASYAKLKEFAELFERAETDEQRELVKAQAINRAAEVGRKYDPKFDVLAAASQWKAALMNTVRERKKKQQQHSPPLAEPQKQQQLPSDTAQDSGKQGELLPPPTDGTAVGDFVGKAVETINALKREVPEIKEQNARQFDSFRREIGLTERRQL